MATVKYGKTIDLIPITPGRDFGTSVEVLSGLKGDESVVVNPPDSLAQGQAVQVVQTQPAGAGGAKQ